MIMFTMMNRIDSVVKLVAVCLLLAIHARAAPLVSFAPSAAAASVVTVLFTHNHCPSLNDSAFSPNDICTLVPPHTLLLE